MTTDGTKTAPWRHDTRLWRSLSVIKLDRTLATDAHLGARTHMQQKLLAIGSTVFSAIATIAVIFLLMQLPQ